MKNAAKCIGALYNVAVTAGYSTSTVESDFSVLARIDSLHRRRRRGLGSLTSPEGLNK